MGYIIEPDSLGPLTYFARANLDGWYRPLQMVFLSAVQTRYGLWTVPIHLTHILLHAVTTGFVYSLARRFGLGAFQAVLAALFFLVAQANAIAVLSIDTLSTIFVTLFGLITLWLLVPGDFSAESVALRRLSQYCFAPLTFLLSLLSKESSVSVWPMAVVCLAAFPEVAQSKPIDWRRKRQLILVALPLLLVLLVYLVLRSAAGAMPAEMGQGPYQFRVGLNIPSNLAMILGAALTPVSTVSIMNALTLGDTIFLLGTGLVAAGSLLVAIWGLWQDGRAWLWLVVTTVGVISLFPMVLLNHVSEMYAYGAMPFVGMLLGGGWAAVLERFRARRLILVLGSIGLAGLLLLNVAGIQSKAHLMVANGEAVQSILLQLKEFIPAIPANGRLLLVNPPSPVRSSYSVFIVNGFDVFEGRRETVYRSGDRSDFGVRIVDAEAVTPDMLTSDTLAVTLEQGRVVPYAGS
ncbi:MAG: hypothetical protein NTY23_08100 [Chloroflexi bacterium]|nr:hypothetical protein [Chloroflexota bacterium]